MVQKQKPSEGAAKSAVRNKNRISSSKRASKAELLSVYPLEAARPHLDNAIQAAIDGKVDRLVFRELSPRKLTFFWNEATFEVDREAYEYALDRAIRCGVLVTLFDELPYLEF